MNIYDENWPTPDMPCYDADTPGQCQIQGSDKFDLPGFNTIAIHEHMGDTCGWSMTNPETC